jgi:serine/threonine protein kinase
MSEMVLGHPVFGVGPADDKEQVSRILKYLGPPTRKDFKEMHVKRRLSQIVKGKMDEMRCCAPSQVKAAFKLQRAFIGCPVHDEDLLLDLLLRMLVYSPRQRLSGYVACAHDFFLRLRERDVKLPNGNKMPNFFDFSSEELEAMPSQARHIFDKVLNTCTT